MASLKKQNQFDALTKVLTSSANFALIKHEKTKHIALEKLRKELKKNKSSVKVVKNSIMQKAVQKLAQKDPSMKKFASSVFPLKETSALISFNADWSEGLSAFYKYSEKEQSLSFKAGILDHAVYSGEDLNKIAKLPARPQLMAKVIGSMKSPMYSLVWGMKFNMQKLVYILNEQSKKG